MLKPPLFLLHFAGGNRYSFQFLVSHLKNFDIVIPELPGRGRRMEEPLLKDFDQAAADLYRQIIRKLPSRPFMIYGHSMGAYLALRVTNMLERAGTTPSYLFVSGNAGPGVREEKKRYLLEHDEFWLEIRNLGGLPKEFLESEELFEVFEPILKADFEIAERNGLADEPPVSCPLFAMMGDKEEQVELIENWSRFTSLKFQYEVLEGDHFFIHKHAGRISRIIEKAFNNLKISL